MKRAFLIAASLILVSCGSAQKQITVSPKLKPGVKAQKPVSLVKGEVAKPIYVPPEVVRVLIYPYEDDSGVLHQGEFLYFVARQGYWTIASRGQTVKVKKFVSIVNTQKALDQRDSVRLNWVRPAITRPVAPERIGGKPIPKPETPDTDSKLKEIRDYVGKR